MMLLLTVAFVALLAALLLGYLLWLFAGKKYRHFFYPGAAVIALGMAVFAWFYLLPLYQHMTAPLPVNINTLEASVVSGDETTASDEENAWHASPGHQPLTLEVSARLQKQSAKEPPGELTGFLALFYPDGALKPVAATHPFVTAEPLQNEPEAELGFYPGVKNHHSHQDEMQDEIQEKIQDEIQEKMEPADLAAQIKAHPGYQFRDALIHQKTHYSDLNYVNTGKALDLSTHPQVDKPPETGGDAQKATGSKTGRELFFPVTFNFQADGARHQANNSATADSRAEQGEALTFQVKVDFNRVADTSSKTDTYQAGETTVLPEVLLSEAKGQTVEVKEQIVEAKGQNEEASMQAQQLIQAQQSAQAAQLAQAAQEVPVFVMLVLTPAEESSEKALAEGVPVLEKTLEKLLKMEE